MQAISRRPVTEPTSGREFRSNVSYADDVTAFDPMSEYQASIPMPPGAFLQVTTENCLVTWSTAKGRFDSRVIPTKDLVAFVEKLESKDCYNVAWAEAGY